MNNKHIASYFDFTYRGDMYHARLHFDRGLVSIWKRKESILNGGLYWECLTTDLREDWGDIRCGLKFCLLAQILRSKGDTVFAPVITTDTDYRYYEQLWEEQQ